MNSPVPPAFEAKKNKILADLSIPDDQYTDASPKGSVDSGIRDLITLINGLEGVVTTSSCAGRISVFLEGKKSKASSDDIGMDGTDGPLSNAQSAVPGGKGLGGHWLFVSHDPVQVDLGLTVEAILGVSGQEMQSYDYQLNSSRCRLIKFAFEPMILHIMTASLHHARPILAAALNAGFRESGLQSLRCLDDPNAFPMVAIRTAGLGLSSVIGFCNEEATGDGGKISPLVDDDHLRFLMTLGNERFKGNSERIKRLEEQLRRIKENETESHEMKWEDKAARAERKRNEGLREQARRRG